MYLGRVVELRRTEELIDDRPIHPYSRRCFGGAGARPEVEAQPDRILQGDVAQPAQAAAAAARASTRVARDATDICTTTEPPPLVMHAEQHLAACDHPLNLQS